MVGFLVVVVLVVWPLHLFLGFTDECQEASVRSQGVLLVTLLHRLHDSSCTLISFRADWDLSYSVFQAEM